MRTLKFKFISPEGYEGKSYSRLSPWFVDGHFKVYLTLSWLTVVSKLNLKKQRGGGGYWIPVNQSYRSFGDTHPACHVDAGSELYYSIAPKFHL